MRKALNLIIVCMLVLLFNACEKSTEDFKLASVSDYAPNIIGKYITYNLDSTVFINFGTQQVVRSYQVKHVVDAQITDNLGRPAYRIIRYLRTSPIGAWNPDNTFMVVPSSTSLEFVENNFRFLKLKAPINNGFNWKGNSYIDTYSLNSDVKYLDDWDYTYDSVNLPTKIGALTIDSTVKVKQRDEIIGNPANPNSYSEINFGEEKYAKGLGLIYRNFLHVEYQPPTPTRGGYKQGYGVKMLMIDHN